MDKIKELDIKSGEIKEKKLSFITEIVNEFNEKSLSDILYLEKVCIPESWQYEDAEEYYKKILEDKNSINIFLKHENKIIGYMLAVPFENDFDDLKRYDTELKLDKNNKKMYIETGQVLQDFSKMKGFEKLILAICEESKRRGFEKVSTHARKINGVNLKFRKMFEEKISEIRDIDEWHYGGNEPYEYIEWKL